MCSVFRQEILKWPVSLKVYNFVFRSFKLLEQLPSNYRNNNNNRNNKQQPTNMQQQQQTDEYNRGWTRGGGVGPFWGGDRQNYLKMA